MYKKITIYKNYVLLNLKKTNKSNISKNLLTYFIKIIVVNQITCIRKYFKMKIHVKRI